MSQGVIKKLAQHGAAALKPRKVPTATGQVNPWRRPARPRREAAVARKQAIRDGTFGTFDPEKGGWLREWDPVRAPRVLIPPKGHKRDRTRAERFRNVEARLQGYAAAHRGAPERRPGAQAAAGRRDFAQTTGKKAEVTHAALIPEEPPPRRHLRPRRPRRPSPPASPPRSGAAGTACSPHKRPPLARPRRPPSFLNEFALPTRARGKASPPGACRYRNSLCTCPHANLSNGGCWSQSFQIILGQTKTVLTRPVEDARVFESRLGRHRAASPRFTSSSR